jgi:hypothetical protein
MAATRVRSLLNVRLPEAEVVQSLTNATIGVMTSASLAVSTIGHGLALSQGGISKHAIKQVDRRLSNPSCGPVLLDFPPKT